MLSCFYLIFSVVILASHIALALPTAVPAALKPRQVHYGTATYFYQGGNAGACGDVHADWDFIVALPSDSWANGAHCGDAISITDTDTGATATAVVADLCPGCAPGSIDLSHGLFNVFAGDDQGVFPVSWRLG